MESKDIIDDIEKLIMDGCTLRKCCELTGISDYYVEKAINDLNYAKSAIFDEARYQKLKNKIRENRFRSCSRPQITLSEYKNYIDDIDRYISAGIKYGEIESTLGLPNHYVSKIIDALNNPKSDIYDKERYQRIVNTYQEIMILKTSERSKKVAQTYRDNDNNKKPLAQFINLIITKKITIFEASTLSKMTLLESLLYLSQVKDEELKKGLYPYLESYGVWLDFSKKDSKKLKDCSPELKKEIALLALTYRVSFKAIAKLLHTTVLDVMETFKSLETVDKSLNYLFLETLNESDEFEELAFSTAKEYMIKRKLLIKNLASCQNESEKIMIKIQLKRLRSKINDYPLFAASEKETSLTQEDRDLIARYPLKYYISLKECSRRLRTDFEYIRQCIEDLSMKDVIYREKIAMYSAKFKEINIQYQLKASIDNYYNNNGPQR